MYRKFIKRLLDIVLSGIALIILSPIMLFVAIFVRIKLGSPVLFIQERPGKDEKLFRLYKFRSMTDKRNEYGNLLPDEVRLTSFGRFLRSTSLDGKVIIRQTLKNLDFARVSPVLSNW